MFRALFFTTVFVTLAVNIIFLFATKDKPPDPTGSTTTLVSVISGRTTGASGSAEDRSAAANAGLLLDGSHYYSIGDDGNSDSVVLAQGGANERTQQQQQAGLLDASHKPQLTITGHRRLFLRSNDFYDYSPAAAPVAPTIDLYLQQQQQQQASSQEAIDNNRSTASSQSGNLQRPAKQAASSKTRKLIRAADSGPAAITADQALDQGASSNSFTPQPPAAVAKNADANERQKNTPDPLGSSWPNQRQSPDDDNETPPPSSSSSLWATQTIRDKRRRDSSSDSSNGSSSGAELERRDSRFGVSGGRLPVPSAGSTDEGREYEPSSPPQPSSSASSSGAPKWGNNAPAPASSSNNNRNISSELGHGRPTGLALVATKRGRLEEEESGGNGETKGESSNGNNLALGASANEITHRTEAQEQPPPTTATRTRTESQANNTLAIRVKSSKNHVLIKVDNLIIYESGSGTANEPAQWQLQQQQHGIGDKTPSAFSKRPRRRAGGRHFKHHRSPVASAQQQQELLDDKNANPPLQQYEPQELAESELQAAAKDDDNYLDETTATGSSTTGARIASSSSSSSSASSSSAAMTIAGRGIHVLVLNQFEGSVMSKRLFDTYSPQQDDELALYLGQIQPGRLVIMAVQDEASFKMARSSRARKLIEETLKSRHIMELNWRDMWALVGRKRAGNQLETNVTLGRKSGGGLNGSSGPPSTDDDDEPLAEGLSRSARFTEWGQPVEISAEFKLETRSEADAAAPSGRECDFGRGKDSAQVHTRRRLFCDRIEGYGRLCDCYNPSRLEFSPDQLDNSQLLHVPIVVIAGNRPYYLYRMLRSLLQARGVQASMVTVFIDGFYDEPREICKLLNLRYVQNKPEGQRSARISHHYKTSLTHTFERLFPAANYAIIFEEDLDVARDALVYFNQTLKVLETDPSLYCVSAWNDQGYEHSVGDLTQVMRVETMPGLGWMLTRRLFVEELKAKWPPASQQHDWDMWIRTPQVRRGRECLIPDVSRTYHFGSTGTNINSYFQRQYFSKHAFSDNLIPSDPRSSSLESPSLASEDNAIQFDSLDSMDESNYERLVWNLMQDQDERHSRQWLSAGYNQTGEQHKDQQQQLDMGSAGRAVLMSREALCAYANVNSNNLTTSQTLISTNRNNQRPMKISTLNVIFIKMIDSEDFANWLRLAKCWRLWDLDARGQHKSMWRLFVNGQPTLVVGHPVSPYSQLKPAQVVPYDFY
uniref:Protein O-linked-mannose beta-1,2-N-acetylglucosaminyltransferase 1 n=1 Tax=Aceria tosichella TaxID=561515 RepID=A0A6G1S5J3_9ACAR